MDILNSTDIELLEICKPIAQKLESGWNNNDYETFIENVAPDRKSSISIESFNKQRAKAIEELGESSLKSLIAIHRNPENVVVIWEIGFKKRPEPGVGVYCFSEINGVIKVASSLHHH